MIFGALNACKKDDDPEPSTGTLKGTVTDVASNPIEGVRIIIYNSATNSPTNETVTTNANGEYSVELDPGSYYLNLNKQSYMGIPAPGITPVSVEVVKGQETISDYIMQASPITGASSITGKVTTSAGDPIAGALVVAGTSNMAYSSATDAEGVYYIFNVPAGTYGVNAFLAGFNSTETSATVVSGEELTDINITADENAGGVVSGAITFLATENGVVDVALTHPITKETIPGLNTITTDGNYQISKVPNGTYIARASFENDTYVVDPDWIIKNGEPLVTVANNTIDRPFSVTGAVILNSPTNEATTTQPVEITETTPTFDWKPYSSSSDYVIEVSDINGNVIWGGFGEANGLPTKKVVIPSSETSVVFNSDGTAGTLQSNVVYRWRVFASKDDTKEATGWKLISASEEQMGIFIIK